jgi:hypothetical protein
MYISNYNLVKQKMCQDRPTFARSIRPCIRHFRAVLKLVHRNSLLLNETHAMHILRKLCASHEHQTHCLTGTIWDPKIDLKPMRQHLLSLLLASVDAND